MLKKLLNKMNSYKREENKINVQFRNETRFKNNQTKIEKYIKNINEIIDTNPIFF